MLTMLRKKKIAKKVIWILAIIIIPAFVLWGAGSLSKRRSPYKYIGTIDGKKIPVDDFIKSIKTVQVGLFLNYFNQPQALNKIQKDRKLLNRLAWEGLIIKAKAKKGKTVVSDEEVVNFITTHPLFLRGGVFDDKLYKYILKNSLGITPRVFEESVRNFLIASKYRTDIIKNVTVSDEEVFKVYKNEFEKAKIRYLIVDKKNFENDVKISEVEITSFYEKNKKRFKDPEKVVLQYIAFPHKKEGEKEKALSVMRTAYERLKGEHRNMEIIAERLKLTVKETPPFSRDEIVPGIETISDIGLISFRLRPLVDILPLIGEKEKGISYIIRVRKKILPRIKAKNEISPYITAILVNQKARELAKEEAENIYRDAKDNNMSLRKIAKKYNLELKETELVSRFDYIGGVGESYKIVDNACKLKIGQMSEPIEVRKGSALIEPAEIQSIDKEKFESKKENYRNKVLSTKKMKALEDWFEKAKGSASLEVDLDSL